MTALGKAFAEMHDGENNALEFDVAYPLTGRLQDAIEELRRRHDEPLYLLPISGSSAGGGIFQSPSPRPGSVVGLRFDAPANPRVRLGPRPPLAELEIDEIVIDHERQQLSAGAAVTLHQLNQALAHEVGHEYRVPGADLTSYMYAAAGATFMTGGMGPQRRYFSDCVDQVALHDGNAMLSLEGEALGGYAGTYGWSGAVAALCCNYYRFPRNEIAFALPIKHGSDDIADLLQKLAPHTRLQVEAGNMRAAAGPSDLVLGLEHVSSASMTPLLRDGGDNPVTARARDLRRICDAAGADGLVFVNGCSERSIDEFLLQLADEDAAENFSIAGIELEFAEVFNDPEEMRALREAIPWAARMQRLRGRRIYKNHSDANIRIVADDVGGCARRLWQINRDYVAAVESHFRQQDGIDGEILVYGHLNPCGFDPHNRVTMSSDDDAAFERSREFLREARAAYYRELASLCRGNDAIFVGGEKTADSEIAILDALGGPQQAPDELQRRFHRQRAAIARASPMFNWRALPPYR